MKPLISLILPVYNVEKYLDKCIKSVLEQDYTNLEIILVDDGSTDSSGSICDNYAKTDSRIIVIHKQNGGLSDARNAGASAAKGEYISFIDSDDSVLPTYVSYLYSVLKKYNADMSLCTHTVVKDKNKIIYGDGSDEVLSPEAVLERMLYHNVIDTSAWAKLYRREMVLRFPYPKGKLFEDIGTTYQFFMACPRIACGYVSQYFYYVRPNSIVTGAFNSRKLELLEMTDKMAEDVIAGYPHLGKAVLRRRIYARFSTLNQMLDTDSCTEERKKIIKFIKSNSKSLLRDKKAPRRDKAACLILLLGFPAYKYIWKFYSK